MNKGRWKDMCIGGVVVLLALLVIVAGWNAIVGRSTAELSDEVAASVMQGFMFPEFSRFFGLDQIGFEASPDEDPGSGGGSGSGSGSGQISEKEQLVKDLLSLRKDVKDKAFSWQPHKRAQMPHLLRQMEEKGLTLIDIVLNEDGPGASQKTVEARVKYAEFSAAVLAPVVVLPGHVPGWYKRAVEKTAGPLDDAIRALGE